VRDGSNKGLFRRIHRWLRRDWRKLVQHHWRKLLGWREHIRLSEETFHLIMAAAVGVLGGLVNLLFYYGIESSKWLFYHNLDDAVVVAEQMGLLARLLTPALGGLVAGAILHWGGRLVKGKASNNLLEAVIAGDGRLPLRAGLVKSLSSLMSIGSGASIGREGGITQLSATFASKWGQWMKWPPYRLRLLVGCAASAGIAAAYNAPIAGAVFAAWIVLGNFSMNQFAPLVMASVAASLVSRSFFGIEPGYEVPDIEFTRLNQIPWFVVLGILCGALGAGFQGLMHLMERWFKQLSLPLPLQLAAGGLGVGLIALEFPGVCGNGYVVINRILDDVYPAGSSPILFLTGLLLAKLLATAMTVGSGGVGGVLTPTLFLGAAQGAALGVLLHSAGYAAALPTAVFSAVGMGAALAATTRSPLLAIVLIFEISLNYSLMPPLMVATVIATLVARRFSKESVYTEVFRQRGISIGSESERGGSALESTVGDLMQPPVTPIAETASLADIAQRFLTVGNNFIPVVDAQKRLVGMIALQDLKQHLTQGEDFKGIIALDVMRPPPPVLCPAQQLLEALPVIVASEQRNVPVVNNRSDMRLVGAVFRAEAMGVVAEAIDGKSTTGLSPVKPDRQAAA
jgi:CIC family chloride channel protein